MKTIIHDLEESYDSLFKSKTENVIHADGKYAPCQGCFGCWTKHPAQCYMKDKLQMVCRMIGKADELIIVTENYYGAYSPAVKNVLDRSIGISSNSATDSITFVFCQLSQYLRRNVFIHCYSRTDSITFITS